jgi:hypothetical protein
MAETAGDGTSACADAVHHLGDNPATWIRGGLRAARRLVMRRGWHNRPVIDPVLRRLGRRLP